MTAQKARVIIIGAGFGGLNAAQTLAGQAVDVLVIDRNNFHTFTPLLYQVATSGLDPSEVVYPVRQILQKASNIDFLMGEVVSIDHTAQQVQVRTRAGARTEPYDYLIIAAGSVTQYYGNEAIARNAFGLKDLKDAVVLRNHILSQFEQAAWTDDIDHKRALTTMVVVGGGPTGIETAGALHELYHYVLRHEYPEMNDLTPHVILVEASDRLLAAFPAPLRDSARQQLESLGVEIVLGSAVEHVDAGIIRLANGRVIPAHTVVWSTGVAGSPLGRMLDVPLALGGRVPVLDTLEVHGREHIYVVGDLAYLEDESGTPYPQVAQVAIQQGKRAAHNVLRRTENAAENAFQYRDLGIMATVGRSRAVAWLGNRVPLTGFIAWVVWLGLHLVWLIGFRNRASVLVGWIWNYLTYDRSVRIILENTTRHIPANLPETQ